MFITLILDWESLPWGFRICTTCGWSLGTNGTFETILHWLVHPKYMELGQWLNMDTVHAFFPFLIGSIWAAHWLIACASFEHVALQWMDLFKLCFAHSLDWTFLIHFTVQQLVFLIISKCGAKRSNKNIIEMRSCFLQKGTL